MLIGHHHQFAFASQGKLDANAKVVTVSRAASDIERAWTLLSCLLVVHSFLIQHFLDVYWAQSDDLLTQPPSIEGWLYAAIFAGFMVVVVLCVREPRLRAVFQDQGITFLKGRFLGINCDANRIVGLRTYRVTSLDNTATLEIENRDGGKWKYYGFEYEGLREAASAYAAERGYAFSETTYSPFYYRWSAIKIALAVMVVFTVFYLLFLS